MSIDLLKLQEIGESYNLAYGVATKFTLNNTNTFTAAPDGGLYYTDIELLGLKPDSIVLTTLQDASGSTAGGDFATSCWIVKAVPTEVPVALELKLYLRIFFADNPADYMTADDDYMILSTYYH